MLVGMLVARAARRYGSRVALVGPQGTQTFAELGDRVARLAGGLRGLGLRPGDRVLDLQPNQNTSIEVDLACATAGLIRVALNHRLHPDDWARIADDCGAAAMTYDHRYAEASESLRHGMTHTVVIGDGSGVRYDKLIADARPGHHVDHVDHVDRADAPPEPAPDDLVSLNYTSGTTGRPKGVRRTHRVRFASLVNMIADVLGGAPGPDDVYLHAGPVTHTSGLFVLPFLVSGAAQRILLAFDPGAVAEAVREQGVTHTALVPTMVARLLTHGEPLPGLKMLGYAGAPMPPEQIRQAYERLTPRLVQYYGLVEAIPPVTVLDAADHAAGLTSEPDVLTSAGRPALGVELSIMDDDGRHRPIGEIGEVVTRGDHVMPGYWSSGGNGTGESAGNGTGDTAARAVDARGWLHTGDLGRMDHSGRLWLVDRKGDMIITGGYNVYPREVEDVIAEVPGVGEVAVIGVADPDWGQRIVALYTGTPGPGAIEAHCRARLASYKKPKEVRQVDRFPLNATGKIAKNVLRAQMDGR